METAGNAAKVLAGIYLAGSLLIFATVAFLLYKVIATKQIGAVAGAVAAGRGR